MSEVRKEMYPSLRHCKDGTLLCYELSHEKLSLPDISYFLSQGRYLILICIVRKVLTSKSFSHEISPPPPHPRELYLGRVFSACKTGNRAVEFSDPVSQDKGSRVSRGPAVVTRSLSNLSTVIP